MRHLNLELEQLEERIAPIVILPGGGGDSATGSGSDHSSSQSNGSRSQTNNSKSHTSGSN